MIGFSIMMWFVSFVILMVAVALLRGNVSTMHGKVFDTTEDKVGYGKQLGKMSLFISIGLCTCGVVAFLIKSSMAVVNGRFCPQSVRSFCPIVAGFNAGTYKVPACVL